ncbi:MAG: hypothetical protein RR514_07795 [Christensenella sp.]
MKYAVEGRVFDNGKIIAKVRLARQGEGSEYIEAERCDIWIDVFDNEQEANKFYDEYKNA